MIITSEFFSFNVWEWFLPSSVLEQTESDLSKINWLPGVILLNPIVLVPWDRFPLCHTPIRPIFTFRDQISILIVGCVTDHEVRINLANQFYKHCHLSSQGSEMTYLLMVVALIFQGPEISPCAYAPKHNCWAERQHVCTLCWFCSHTHDFSFQSVAAHSHGVSSSPVLYDYDPN